MRIEPTELAVVELGMQSNFVACIIRNVQTKVRRVRRARRDQMDVHNRPGCPGVAFVDGIAVAVYLQRTVKVSSGLDGAFAVVFDFSAPENCLAFFIGGLQFKPYVESVHGPAGANVPALGRTHTHVKASIGPTPHGPVGALEGSGAGTSCSCRAVRGRDVEV